MCRLVNVCEGDLLVCAVVVIGKVVGVVKPVVVVCVSSDERFIFVEVVVIAVYVLDKFGP